MLGVDPDQRREQVDSRCTQQQLLLGKHEATWRHRLPARLGQLGDIYLRIATDRRDQEVSSLEPGRHPCSLVGAFFARDLDAALRPAEVVACPEASEAERRDRIDRREVACNQKVANKGSMQRGERDGGSGSVGNIQRPTEGRPILNTTARSCCAGIPARTRPIRFPNGSPPSKALADGRWKINFWLV